MTHTETQQKINVTIDPAEYMINLNHKTMYKLFKGFKKIGEFKTIIEAKKAATKAGIYNLIGDNGYKDSWINLKNS